MAVVGLPTTVVRSYCICYPFVYVGLIHTIDYTGSDPLSVSEWTVIMLSVLLSMPAHVVGVSMLLYMLFAYVYVPHEASLNACGSLANNGVTRISTQHTLSHVSYK